MMAVRKTISLIFLISVLIVSSKDVKKDEINKEQKETRTSAKLPPCAACNALVKSFDAGMQRTSRGKLGGGDTAWEERNQVLNYIYNMYFW